MKRPTAAVDPHRPDLQRLVAEPAEPRLLSFEAWYSGVAVALTARIVAAVGDPVLGREVAAEALARAYERWPRVRAMESPEGWVHRTAVNLCRRSWRRRQMERRALAKLGGRGPVVMDSAAAGADDPLVAGHRPEELAPLVAGLPPRMRQAVELRYWGELSEAEVGQRMAITEGAASALLSQARRRLSGALSSSRPSDPPSESPEQPS